MNCPVSEVAVAGEAEGTGGEGMLEHVAYYGYSAVFFGAALVAFLEGVG